MRADTPECGTPKECSQGPFYSALDPATGARVLMPLHHYFDRAGKLRTRCAPNVPQRPGKAPKQAF